MGWWATGENGNESIGDEPADTVAAVLAKLGSMRRKKRQPPPSLQELLDSIAAAMGSKETAHLYHFHHLRATLSNGVELVSNIGAQQGRAMIAAVKNSLIEIDKIYLEAFERSPTVREIVDNFAFVLGYEPSRFLSGLDHVEIKSIRAE